MREGKLSGLGGRDEKGMKIKAGIPGLSALRRQEAAMLYQEVPAREKNPGADRRGTIS